MSEEKPEVRTAVQVEVEADGDDLASAVIQRRPSTTAVHKAAAAFAKHKLPQKGAMAQRLSWFITTLLGWVFTRVDFGERTRKRITQASEEGQLVYVFQTSSSIDYLFFNWAFLEHGLPLSTFANEISTMWLHPVRVFARHLLYRRSRRRPDYQLAAFDYHLGCGHPLWVFLNRPRSDEDQNLQVSQSYLVRMMEVHRRTERPIYIVPTLLVWDKRPDSTKPSLFDELFGTSQSPGFFRKAAQFLNMSWQSFFVFGAPIATVGEPINLNEFRDEYPEADMAEAAELLRQRLEETLAQERQVIMGPPLKQTRTLKAEVLRKPALVDAVRKASLEHYFPESALKGRAKAQLDEIAADFTLLGIKTLGAILSPIFYLIYRGFHVDEDGLQRLREVARDSRVILVPSHKSYIDFLVLSYVFYERGLIPPHIAAGINLSFWPAGPLFRRCGAFFLRRTFKGDPIYGAVFKHYLVKLLEEGFMIEFFPEGTRSRTGKLIKPKYGMVRMILDASLSGSFEKLVFQPISIGYEKIIEGSSYSREAKGGEKKEESAASLLKASSVLISNYGRVYIEFAEPIKLSEYMARYAVPREDATEEQLQRLTVRLAHRVMYDVAEVTPVTPSALAATVLMTAPGKGISGERFLIEAGFLLHYLIDPHDEGSARLTTPLAEALERSEARGLFHAIREGVHPPPRDDQARREDQLALGRAVEPVLHQALKLLQENHMVDIQEVHGERLYALNDKKRPDLNYYKNNIIHFFVAPALLAAGIVREGGEHEVPLQEAQERSLFLSRLFKQEFFYKERSIDDVEQTQFKASFGRALDVFIRRGWVELDMEAQVIRYPDPYPAGLEYFRTLLLPYIEPYAFTARHLGQIAQADPEQGVDQKDFLKELLKAGDLAFLQGDCQYSETLSKPAFENTLTFFLDIGVLQTRRKEGRRGRSTTMLVMAPAWREGDRYKEFAARIEPFTGRNRRKPDRAL